MATGISADGSRIAGYGSVTGQSPMTSFWLDIPSNTLVVDLFGPSNQNYHSCGGQSVTGMSADGTMVVGQGNGPPAVWSLGKGPTTLAMPSTLPGAGGGTAKAISGVGSMIVGSITDSAYNPYFPSPSSPQVAQWINGAPELLPQLYGAAHGISINGQFLVGSGMQDLAWVLQNGGADLHDCILQNASAISADGRWVAGGAICYGNGFPYRGAGYLADLGAATELPAPPPISLFGLALLAVAGARRNCANRGS